MKECCCSPQGSYRHLIVIQVKHRSLSAPRAQEILTEHGCQIKVRLGIHEDEPDHGLIMVLAEGTKGNVKEMITSLSELPEVSVTSMEVPRP